MLADEWLKQNQFFDQPPRDALRLQSSTVLTLTFSRFPAGYTRPRRRPRRRHSFEILADWGVDADRIAALADDGVVMCLS